MGYMMVIGACVGCRKTFSFNPHLVPSMAGEPICQECVNLVNPIRQKNGLPLIEPHPDAYEPSEE